MPNGGHDCKAHMHSDHLLPIQAPVDDGREGRGGARIKHFPVEASCGLPATEFHFSFGMPYVFPIGLCGHRQREFLSLCQREPSLARPQLLT